MKKPVRTDLAVEARSLHLADGELPGVTAEERDLEGFAVTTVRITSDEASDKLCKPKGVYHSVSLEPVLRREDDAFGRAAAALASLLRETLPLSPDATVFVVGLGNRAITPDAIGPEAAEQILATRHLRAQLPEQFSYMRGVSVLAPGVLGMTGIESAEMVKTLCAHVRADAVVAIDALACSESERLCRTVQITDAGIVPGSGVGNDRAAFDRESLGVPVAAVGVPTVMDAGVVGDAANVQGLFITPRDIDMIVRDFSKVVAYAVNLALQPELSIADLDLLLS